MTTAVRVLGLLQISVAVVLAQGGWGVTYTTQSICAYTGSTVEMSCSYTYPSGNVISTFWVLTGSVKDLTTYSDYSGRVTYRDTTNGNTVRIKDLRMTDSVLYKFRFKTNNNQYTGTPGVTLSVTDGPKNTLVSVSPSGEIMEGSLVTLTCTSDANPPVKNYTWYKKNVASPKASGQSYSITNIRPEDSGEYVCKAENECGHFNSSSVFVDVHYGPKNTSISVSPSGEIVEGSSVTLTCSSDANPPVNKYTWYKKNVTSPKASGQSYSITNIRSEDSGEYYCEVQNEYGRLNDSSVIVDVHYGPKNTSVWAIPSGEIMEDSLVTLSCSSDANPPVNNYTWYKWNVTSPIASGQSYNITSFSPKDDGAYYCEAMNEHGRRRSNSIVLMALCKQCSVIPMVIGITLVLVVLILCISGFLWFRKKNTKSIPDTVDEADSGKGNSFSSISVNTTTTETPVTDNLEDIHYASFQFSSSKKQEEPVYSNFQLPQLQKEEEDVQYAPLRLNCPGDSPQPLGYGAEQDPSALYSTVNIPKTKLHEISKT
ncbi:hypothetical protein UPYG_G00062470 [Umbra pygmaea]|uniref:Ig-like domain-containing protein n=1 Tax=Umbra pygmaea TaxID=75934 RepID=A0ABD0X9P5_UMBPY